MEEPSVVFTPQDKSAEPELGHSRIPVIAMLSLLISDWRMRIYGPRPGCSRVLYLIFVKRRLFCF